MYFSISKKEHAQSSLAPVTFINTFFMPAPQKGQFFFPPCSQQSEAAAKLQLRHNKIK